MNPRHARGDARGRCVDNIDAIRDAIAAGDDFDEVEDRIDNLLAADDLKSALWLLAWSELPQDRQRRFARETLDAIEQYGS
jgi:hypothetical protein